MTFFFIRSSFSSNKCGFSYFFLLVLVRIIWNHKEFLSTNIHPTWQFRQMNLEERILFQFNYFSSNRNSYPCVFSLMDIVVAFFSLFDTNRLNKEQVKCDSYSIFHLKSLCNLKIFECWNTFSIRYHNHHHEEEDFAQ